MGVLCQHSRWQEICQVVWRTIKLIDIRWPPPQLISHSSRYFPDIWSIASLSLLVPEVHFVCASKFYVVYYRQHNLIQTATTQIFFDINYALGIYQGNLDILKDFLCFFCSWPDLRIPARPLWLKGPHHDSKRTTQISPPQFVNLAQNWSMKLVEQRNIFLLPHWRLKLFQIRLADKLTIDTVVPVVIMTDLGSQRECSCANLHSLPTQLFL